MAIKDKLLLHAEYSFRDINFNWDQLTPAEKLLLSRDDMKEIKRLVGLIHAPTEVKETYLTDLVFPACSRLPNIFSLNNLETVKDLMDFGTRGLYGFKNFGRKSLSQLEEALGTLGVVLPTEGPRTPLRQRAKQQPLFTS